MAEPGGAMTTAVVAAQVAVTAAGWRQAVRAACRPLVRGGAVQERYVERCIALLEEQGPYVVLAPGIALVHARPEDGAVSLGLSAVTVDPPVAFGHPVNDPVDVVFAFASPDRESHLGLLAALSRHLLGGLGDALRAAGSDREATALLEEVVRDR
jgi:PTS system ascorbate-specific IIA component